MRNKSPQPPLKPEKPSSPFCATVSFAELASANIVGYSSATALEAEGEAVGGTAFIVPQFTSVADTDYSIQDIKLDPAKATAWVDCITTISQEGDGDTIVSYYWVTDYDPLGDGNTITGWLSSDYVTLATDTIKKGECVIVQTTEACAITTSGAVSQGASSSYTMNAAGSYFIGNVCPVEKNIQGFALDKNTATPWVDCITTISKAGDGDTLVSYYWVTDYDALGNGKTITGWLGEDYVSLASDMIKPGEGLIIQVSQPSSVEIPSAL